MGRLLAGLRDATERGEWASRFNTGGKSLGEIIAVVYQERDAHWTAPANRPNSPKRKAPVPAATESPSQPEYPSARTLKDGAALCDALVCCADNRCPGPRAAHGAFRELSRRWQPVTVFLQQQHPAWHGPGAARVLLAGYPDKGPAYWRRKTTDSGHPERRHQLPSSSRCPAR